MWVFPHEWLTDENPGVATSGVFYSFCYGGLDHRLITDYLSPSNHLQTRWLITPATTAITRDVIASTWTPPSCCQYWGGNRKSIPQIYYRFHSFFSSLIPTCDNGNYRNSWQICSWAYGYFRPILDIYFLLLKSTFRYIKISGKPYKITMSLTLAKSRNRKPL